MISFPRSLHDRSLFFCRLIHELNFNTHLIYPNPCVHHGVIYLFETDSTKVAYIFNKRWDKRTLLLLTDTNIKKNSFWYFTTFAPIFTQENNLWSCKTVPLPFLVTVVSSKKETFCSTSITGLILSLGFWYHHLPVDESALWLPSPLFLSWQLCFIGSFNSFTLRASRFEAVRLHCDTNWYSELQLGLLKAWQFLKVGFYDFFSPLSTQVPGFVKSSRGRLCSQSSNETEWSLYLALTLI